MMIIALVDNTNLIKTFFSVSFLFCYYAKQNQWKNKKKTIERTTSALEDIEKNRGEREKTFVKHKKISEIYIWKMNKNKKRSNMCYY